MASGLPKVDPGSVEDDAAVRSVLDALAEAGVVDATVQGTTVTLPDGSAGTPARAADAIDAARAAEPAAYRTIRTTVRVGLHGEVELGTTGSTDLVRLAGRLERLDHLAELRIASADARPQRTPSPPGNTDASVSVTLEPVPSLDVAIGEVAPPLERWRSATRSLSLYVVAVDDEGRQPSAALRLDRRGSGWVASGLGRGTAEGERAAVAAWTAASRR